VEKLNPLVNESEGDSFESVGVGYGSIFDLHLRWKGQEDGIRVHVFGVQIDFKMLFAVGVE